MTKHLRKTLEDYTGPRDRGPKWRAPLRRPVRLHYPPLQDFFEAVTENISEGGVFIQSTTIPPVGAALSFSITLGEGLSPIQGFGRVIWISVDKNGASRGIGIRFVYLSGKNSNLVRRIVAENRSDDCPTLRRDREQKEPRKNRTKS